MRQDHDYDWLVIGSGFGGSVAALRLREKGHRVGRDGVRAPVRRRRAAALHLGPAPLLLRAPARAARDLPAVDVPRRHHRLRSRRGRRLARLREHALPRAERASTPTRSGPTWTTGSAALAPHYDEAERMLGVTEVVADDPADQLLREYGREIGAEAATPRRASASTSASPGSHGRPTRTSAARARTRAGCILCGRCMVGCPYNAKNTLVKNYLWLAERAGAEVLPEREVVDVRPVGAPDGSDGYEVTTERPGAWLRRDRRTVRGARRRARRRRAGHQQAARPLQARGLAAARVRPARRLRAHQLGGDPRGHAAQGLRSSSSSASRSPRASTRIPTRTSRPSPTAMPATR